MSVVRVELQKLFHAVDSPERHELRVRVHTREGQAHLRAYPLITAVRRYPEDGIAKRKRKEERERANATQALIG